MEVRIRQGRFNDVDSLREQALKNGVQYPWLAEPAGYAELAKGNAEKALSYFKTLEASSRQLGSGVHFRASQEGIAEVALYQGRVDDARRQIIAALQTSSSPHDKASYILYLAQIDALNGRSADAKQEVQTAIQTSESADFAITGSRVLAAVGDLRGAEQLLKEHQSSAASLGRIYSATQRFLDGAELRSRPDPNQSISVIAEANRIDPDAALAYYLAHVQMEAGRWKDGSETLTEILDTRGTFMMGESPALLIPLAERDLGICEKHLGNLSEAAKHFSRVKALWSQADAGLKNTLAQADIP
jgi:tetratricopeptide (TPR) repeat protein